MKIERFIIRLVYVILILAQACKSGADIKPGKLTCENLTDPPMVDILTPRLSWINEATSDSRGIYQTAYEIRVSINKKDLIAGKAELWNSGKINSDASINIKYNGKALKSRQDCWWQVRVWDNRGKRSGWSNPGYWGMGILNKEEWKASWIGAPWQGEDPLPKSPYPKEINQSVTPFTSPAEKLPPNAPMLRKGFNIGKKIKSAKAFVSGLGYFELHLNGEKVGDDVLVPNLTLYSKRDDIGPIGAMTGNNFREYRVMYLAYDITKLLNQGENVVGVMLGNGFYNPASFWTQGYGTPRFLGQINILYDDGSEDVIVSDKTWKASKSPILMDLVYDGEHYDAQLEQNGWDSPGFDDSRWEETVLRKPPDGILKAHMSPTDKVMEVLAPQKIEKLGAGHFKVDFGQEISGWLRIKNVIGEKGNRIDFKYICESPSGENSYTMKGGEPESYAARFTWFVFREVEILNWPGELKTEQIQAEAVYTDVETIGKFECSNDLFNKINKIWWRSQTDNMHGGIASDCPHRERSPYTGDGQVACVTVMHNFDTRAFYTKWIQDIFGAQNPENGYVPNGAPWQPGCGGGVGWGAAMNIMPWEYYLHYGDRDLLEANYEGMKGYIRYMLTWTDEDGIMYSQAPEKSNPNRWINLGEWVAPVKLPPDEMVHTFFLWRCANLTAKAAKALGNNEDEKYFSALADKTSQAFQMRFYNETKGSYGPYGGNILALKMGLPDDQRKRVKEALKNDILLNDYHLDTGIFGTQFFFEVLAENGLQEFAFRAMNQKSEPGYGWWIEQGATTTWEKWDGGGSRNHPMFGGGLTWFYRKLSGMNADPDEPGYKHIIFRPQPVEDISWSSYSTLTPYGSAGIKWEKNKDSFSIDIVVPVGSTASVYIPAESASSVTENGKDIKDSESIKFIGKEEGYVIFSVSSGKYSFRSVSRSEKIIQNMFRYLDAGNLKLLTEVDDSIRKAGTTNNHLIRIADSLKDIAQRIYIDFPLNREQAEAQVERRTGNHTDKDLIKWEEKGWLESRIIDGEKRYFNRAVSNMVLLRLFHEDKAGWLKGNELDPVNRFRLKHTENILISTGHNSEPATPVNIKVTYILTVDADAVPDGKTIRCWLPWPKNNHPRQQKIQLLNSSPEDYIFSSDSAVHSTIYLEQTAKKGTPSVFTVSFRYQSKAQYFNPEEIKTEPYDLSSVFYKKYTSEQLPQIHFSDEMKRIADSICAGEENPKRIVHKIYLWFKDNIPWTGALEYSLMPDIPGYVIKNKRGDCGMQTLLYMSMLRYKGIPVRWQSGWMVPEVGKNLHDWCEVYYEGTGWVPSDISYDLQITDNMNLRNYFITGIDAYRLIINDGISGPLHPAKEYPRSEPYDFQRGEVEWTGGNLYFDKWDYNMKIEYQR